MFVNSGHPSVKREAGARGSPDSQVYHLLLFLLLLPLHCFSPPAMSCPPYGVPYPEPTNAPWLHRNVKNCTLILR